MSVSMHYESCQTRPGRHSRQQMTGERTTEAALLVTLNECRDTIPTPAEESIEIYRVHLGELGRYGEVKGDEINRAVKKYILVLEDLLANGCLLPVEGEVAAVGFEQIQSGVEALGKGSLRSGKKVLVQLQEY
jgi:hypothetical protein